MIAKLSINRVLGSVAYGACAISTASAEVALAEACGFGSWISWCLPAALDVYVLVTLRQKRDVSWSVGVLLAMVVMSHLISSGHLEVSWWVVVLVSSVAPLILWRVHGLLESHQEDMDEALEMVRPVPVVDLEKMETHPGELENVQVRELESPGEAPLDLETLVEKLVANGPELPGRSRVMTMYQVSEHTARRGLQEARNILEKIS